MPDKHLFEYAVLRLVPKVEREEFINVGLVLFCAKEKFLGVEIGAPHERLKAFSPNLDLDELYDYLHAFADICKGGPGGGPIGQLPLADRFRWLTATRSTILQTSKVHPGLCSNAEQTMVRLYVEQVL